MSNFTPDPPETQTRYLSLPLSTPMFTYILLALIVLIWLWMEQAGGSTNSSVLVNFGANFGPAILEGELWRFFTSMFLHIGLSHLLFNAYALFIFGLEMERIFGPARFLWLYLMTGLFGSLASFASRGEAVLSAGASGAIFGIIGINIAFFLLHRDKLGEFGRQQLMNGLMIVGINLAFGYIVPGIDNMAHLGGLITGFLMGYGLAPRYEVVGEYTASAHLEDQVNLINRWWVSGLALIAFAWGTQSALAYWG